MITLITGVPGSGKTSFLISEIMNIVNRPIWTMGIPDLKLEHQKVPPVEDWTELRPDPDDPSLFLPYFRFPAGSIICIDEVQRLFPTRMSGSKVPSAVGAFDTHRHTGVDFYLLTQTPAKLDSAIRNMIGRHVHIQNNMVGTYKYEWQKLGDPDSKQSRSEAHSSRYKPSKKTFSLYKSAELHTKPIKAKRPFILTFFVLLMLIIPFVIYKAYQSFKPHDVRQATQAHGGIVGVPVITGLFYDGQFTNLIMSDGSIVQSSGQAHDDAGFHYKVGEKWLNY